MRFEVDVLHLFEIRLTNYHNLKGDDELTPYLCPVS